MKRKILPLFIFVFSTLLTLAQINAGNNITGKGNQNGVATVREDNYQKLEVYFNVRDIKEGEIEIGGQLFRQLTIEGMQSSLQVGAPDLPTWSSLIEVPVCSGYEVTASGMVYDTIRMEIGERGAADPLFVVPVQPSRSKSDRGPFPLVMNEMIYSTDAFFSAAPMATVQPVGVARDRNLARLQFSPVSYNPVSNELIICRRATVTVHYVNPDEQGTQSMFERYHSPMFGVGSATLNNLYPKSVSTSAPVRYLIVAHSMFRGQLDNFITWKRRKGFITDIVYTDDAAVGTTSTSISNYVKSQYTNATTANPAPTYLLIVGDHEQIPAFTGTTESDHITDLYYATWTTGDHIPDCYMGRFSAQNVSQLTPQIEKTLMYEQYTFADPSFLDRAVMVAGVDRGSSGDNAYTYGDPAMDYAITNYVNGAHGYSQVMYFKNETSIVPNVTNVTVGSSASSNSATVRNYYNQGAGWINYTAHGSATSWGTPSFTTSDAAAMTNTQKFGIMIGNCCLTNKFETSTCLGESVLRKDNYCGAVGYIGGSNSTYWGEDFYWAVGVRSGIGPTMSMAYNSNNLGNYDRTFHTHNETFANWATTQGSMVMFGNMAVENSGSGLAFYYWEIYHLMGDPSLMPYLTQAQTMMLSSSTVVILGTSTLSVTTVPHAYVALTDTLTHTLKASGFANAIGNVTLTLPSTMSVGGYELSASAQGYRTAFKNITVTPSSGPYPIAVNISSTTALQAGNTTPLRISVANLGNSNASGVTVALTSNNPLVTLSTSTFTIGSLASGDTVTITNVSATVSSQTPDATNVAITATTNWTGCTTANNYSGSLTVNAPNPVFTIETSATSLMPDSSMTLRVVVTNNGHAPLGSSNLSVTTGNPMLTVSSTGGNFTLAQGASITRNYQLHANHAIDTDIFVPVIIHMGGAWTIDDTLLLYIGRNTTETFEGGRYQLAGWVQGSYPWSVTNEEHHEGSWSARSTNNLGHGHSSELSIDFSITRADSVSFYYKVSSENNYDKFFFYIDGAQKIVASGEEGWTRASYPVTAGNHQLKFAYTKDASVDNGSDCAWIDDIRLPFGAHITSTGNTGGGGDSGHEPDEGDYENLCATFESTADNSRWTLLNGSVTNVWVIGSAASNSSSHGLYITNDGGQTSSYNITSSSSVFAYTTLWLDTGSYDASFDWLCNGESTYDFLRVALIPTSVYLLATTSLPSGWSTTTLPAEAIALDGGQKLNLSSSWQTHETEVHISQSGFYNYVFFWRNDGTQGSMPPAAIDNVKLYRATRYTVAVTATHGTTIGSDVYHEGETATIGVFPEAGFSFAGWSDGNSSNPRQLVVNGDMTLQAILSQSNIITLHDTTVVIQTDTLYRTAYIDNYIHDTTVVIQTDTLYLTAYVDNYIHDTTYIDVPVHDTTIVTQTDTVTITEYVDVPVHDTTFVNVNIHDTTFVIQTDTLTVTEYVPVHDTTYVTVTETITLTDTVTLMEYDTTIVTDTLWLTEYDTVMLYDTIFLHDTVFIHDTIYITGEGIYNAGALNLKVYSSKGQVVVEGADGGMVTLFDVIGRILATKQDEYQPLRFDVPVSGTYMIKVGDLPARKVVVIR